MTQLTARATGGPQRTRERLLDTAERLVMTQGFAATTVDAILAGASASKGAFFHHFASKTDLGRALVQRYAERDARVLDAALTEVELASNDPAEQLVALVRGLETAAAGLWEQQPSCLFVSFIYENGLADPRTGETVRASIDHWRERILEKLRAAAADRPVPPVDLPSLADQVFTVIEGAFLLARAYDDSDRMRAQLAHLRHYLELLFGLPVAD